MTDRSTVRILAFLCVLLAVGCAVLAVAYARKSEEARCLRDAGEEGLAAADC